MKKNKAEHPEAENPETLTGLKRSKIQKKAAGLKAVVSSLKSVYEEAGIVRGAKALKNLNQKGGFDCPSCAWPDPDDERAGYAEYCENGARAVAEEITLKKLDADFFKKHSISEMAAWSDFEMGKKGRIAIPVYRAAGASHYAPISWDDAFTLIANHLNHLEHPDRAAFYTSGRTSNEAAYLYQLFVRAFGTNNLPDCSNMCHESSGVALGESLGIGKGSVTLEDFYEAEVIMILGQNPGTNHPRMLTALQKAKANGAKIIAINPLPETGLIGFNNPQQMLGMLGYGVELTDLFMPVKINGDMALLQAIEKELVQMDAGSAQVLDHTFIQENTLGFNGFKEHLAKLDYNELVNLSGIDSELIKQAASILKDKSKIIVCWAMGLTQHKNAVDTIKEVVNLLLLKGSIGKPGAGTCPVRGHSNVQGDRTMGINEKPPQAFLNSLEKFYKFTPPQHHGLDVVEAIKAMNEGKLDVFIALGGNFLSATPDTQFTAEGLTKCKLTVQISTKLNRSHLVTGNEALILPCLGRSDIDSTGTEAQHVSCENSMGVVQSSKGSLEPISPEMLSEPAIVCRLAKATLGNKYGIKWDKYLEHYDHIRNEIEQVIPGFENYNERLKTPGGFYLPNCNRDGSFNTSSKKAHFQISTPLKTELNPGELMMMTIRSHDQFNTTIYGLDDRYRGIHNERRVILMNKADISRLGFQDGQLVDLINESGGKMRIARKFIIIDYPIPANCSATYFPETNVLVPIDSVAEKSNTPVSKLVIIRLQKHDIQT
ncbi:MAG: FdhF/YdeP family oxidoreductase [Saprospiraceae bacterium]|nr:FdhF/YdeP family oxidoreductase [Saprospiraceae bacterium]